MKNILIHTTVFSLLLTGMVPVVAEASHDGERSRYYEREISRLDEDIVGEFAIPVLFGIELDDITPDFGDPRGGGTRSHEGQDFMAPLGTPIVSPTEAVVTSIGTGPSAGKYVYTRNPGGETFRYMHLDEFGPIKAGDVLKVGDLIGTVGDTGNAMGVAAHLHFEVREGSAKDPYPRVQKEFTLREKITFVNRFFDEIRNEEEMAEFLVTTYPAEFSEALNAGYTLPKEIRDVLKEAGIQDVSALKKQLDDIIATIPSVLRSDLKLGDQGSEVSLLQVFLIYTGSGSAIDALARAGATGYFGSVTEAALREYQKDLNNTDTGVYDAVTRRAVMLAK